VFLQILFVLKKYKHNYVEENMKKAVITGTDHGLGLGFVKVLLEKGYFVYAGCLSLENDSLLGLVEQYPSNLMPLLMDIGNDVSVLEAARIIKQATEEVDLIINNAGILGDIQATILEPLNFAEILKVINVNTLGPLRVTNALIDLLLNGEEKCIINISSEAGSIENNNREAWFGYALSKAALNMEGALIQQKLKDYGVKVMQIHPGWLKTFMHGEKNNVATYEPDEAAVKILDVVSLQRQSEWKNAHQPVYLNLNGERLPW